MVPAGVLHVGGGRSAFLRLLDEQVRRRGRVAGVNTPHAPSPHSGLTPQPGMTLGIDQVAGISGQFIGLLRPRR